MGTRQPKTPSPGITLRQSTIYIYIYDFIYDFIYDIYIYIYYIIYILHLAMKHPEFMDVFPAFSHTYPQRFITVAGSNVTSAALRKEPKHPLKPGPFQML